MFDLKHLTSTLKARSSTRYTLILGGWLNCTEPLYISWNVYSLGVLILCCVTGELPFNTPLVADNAGKAAIRKQLSSSGSPYRNLKAVEPPELRNVLQHCFRSPARLRPSAAWISAKILEIFSDLSYNNSLAVEISTPDSPEVLSAKERCYNLICEARNQVHSRSKQLSTASEADIAILERGMDISANADTDPMSLFLLGSMTWWRLAPDSEWDNKLGIEDTGELYLKFHALLADLRLGSLLMAL